MKCSIVFVGAKNEGQFYNQIFVSFFVKSTFGDFYKTRISMMKWGYTNEKEKMSKMWQ